MDKHALIRKLGPTALEPFMAAFKSFQKLASNGRQAMIRIRNSPDALEKAWRVKFCSRWVDAYLALGEKKVATPPKFSESWRVFNDEYRTAINESVSLAIQSVSNRQSIIQSPAIAWLDALLDGNTNPVVETPEGEVTGYADWLARATRAGDPPFFDTDREFAPWRDDPIRLVDMAVDYFYQQQDKADENSYFDNAYKVGDAWDYLKDTLGLETGELWARWTDVPQVLSAHIGLPTIAELYDEAVRCFTFGQFAAGMVMCRALLEQVLDQLYGAHGDGLAAKIREAEDHFDELRHHQMKGLKDAADDVLHNYTKWRANADPAGVLVKRFLDVLKALIEGAKGRV